LLDHIGATMGLLFVLDSVSYGVGGSKTRWL